MLIFITLVPPAAADVGVNIFVTLGCPLTNFACVETPAEFVTFWASVM
jgi:hypothetical protein